MAKVLTCAALSAPALFKPSLKSLFRQAAIVSVTILALIDTSSPLRAAEAAPDPAGFDILGMKLGMSVAQIEAAIKAYNPSFRIATLKDKVPIQRVRAGSDDIFGVGEFAQSIQATPTSGGDLIKVLFTVTPPSRAFDIFRRTSFPVGQQPLVENMVQQLREKYGPESRLGNGAFYWLFDQAGKQIHDPKDVTMCRGQFFYGNPSGNYNTYSPDYDINLEVNLVSQSADSKVLDGLSERLVGDSIAVDDIRKLAEEAKAAKERQLKEQEENASGVKPPL
jgi:hypothetical protein